MLISLIKGSTMRLSMFTMLWQQREREREKAESLVAVKFFND